MMKYCLLSTFLLFFCRCAVSQQTPNASASAAPQTPSEVVVVTGVFEPAPLGETNRSVVSFDTKSAPLLYGTVEDYLRLDSSIDVRERGSDGTQADLSIRGASFAQALILLNGLRVNDAQTGHHDMDLPIPLESISRIEVLHGAGSTLYGADASGGAVNFITAKPESTELRMLVGAGNYGFNQQRLMVSLVRSRWSEQITARRDFSTGFLADRDYRSSLASSETRIDSALGTTDILFAGSDRPFGANQFYGDFPSWERTRGWYASIEQGIGRDTTAAFAYRRHADQFVLIRDNPSVYENNHVSQTWQAALRRKSDLPKDFVLFYGLDFDGDQIDSNNLGHHARNREAGYLNVDLRSWRRVFLSLGAREEGFSGGRTEFAPTAAGAVWLGKGMKLRASASRAFRLPTYTDLYYSDPANVGNPLLKPESAWSFEAGPEWNPGGRIKAQLTVFDRRERNDIDYIRSSPSGPWQATNITALDFVGVEASAGFKFATSQQISLAYTTLHGNQQLPAGITSKYVFNYPSHNAVFSWNGGIRNQILIRTRVGATQRLGQEAYGIWDLGASRTQGRIRPYLQFSNLGNSSYQEIPGVRMPGRTVIGGFELVWAGKEKNW